MQTKALFKKIIIMLPTSLLLLNLAFAQADYVDPAQDQSDYDAPSEQANDGSDTADSDSGTDTDGGMSQDDAYNVPSDGNDSTNEDDYN